ncbi:MAG: ankyrin repeat domain-containing protein [Erythrobacter sp.]|nr:ankyrin repeat domain-containing protein [Erythrobacter sp.]
MSEEKVEVTRFAFRHAMIAAVALGLSALAPTAPAGAQLYSEGYRFLQAVRNREGTDAGELLNRPGSTVINARDLSTGETGLHITAARSDLTWTRFLLQEGANPNITDNQGRTPLIVASQAGFIEGVRALVAGGALIDVANRTGETPLIAAVHSGNLEMIELLVESGADPDRPDNTGRSARDYARQPGVSPRVLAAITDNESTADTSGGRTYGPVF